MLNFTIKKEEADQTIISFLKKRFKTTPLSLIYKLFRNKKVKIDGKDVRYYHHRLKNGEKIEIFDNYLKQSSHTAIYPLSQDKTYFETIHEDDNIMIVLKEHGIAMNSLDNAVRYYLARENPAEYQKQVENFFVLIAAHRLDKVTKGLVIYPKNPSAKRTLYKAMGDKSQITKNYLAICEKSPKKTLPNFISGYLEKKQSWAKNDIFVKIWQSPSKTLCLRNKKSNWKN
ncbi:MAG: hypothetical protein GBAus27B_000015 [Mycoplasmataceae bacterium]|nr:MAG: hypothetical protein GBAus27B_000015 [Mycoplasmataceae bacterium]